MALHHQKKERLSMKRRESVKLKESVKKQRKSLGINIRMFLKTYGKSLHSTRLPALFATDSSTNNLT